MSTTGGQLAAGVPKSSPVKDRVLKMSSLVDQADDSELLPADKDEVKKWMGAYVSLMGAPPCIGGGRTNGSPIVGVASSSDSVGPSSVCGLCSVATVREENTA